MFFNSQKYSSSETRRPENSSPSSLHRCSTFRPLSCSAAPPIFQESWKSNHGEPSSALTDFQGNGSETKPTSFRAAASWSCRFLESKEASSRSSFSSSSVSAADDVSERDVLENKEASSRSSFSSFSVSAADDVSERDVLESKEASSRSSFPSSSVSAAEDVSEREMFSFGRNV